MQETQQVPPAAYTVAEFCDAHRFTCKFFYDLQKRGIGPRIMKVGTRTLISDEAADDWGREREENAELMEPRRGRRATPLTNQNLEQQGQTRQAEQKPPVNDWRAKLRKSKAAGKGGAAWPAPESTKSAGEVA